MASQSLLHAGYRRLEAIALEAWRLRLRGGDTLLPRSIRPLLARLDTGRDHRRDRRGQHAGFAVIDDVDVVAADQHGRRAFDPLEPLLGIEPRDRRVRAGEALENDPIGLDRRARRHHRLLDEARERWRRCRWFPPASGRSRRRCSGRTRVCVTIVTAPFGAGASSPLERCVPLTAAPTVC